MCEYWIFPSLRASKPRVSVRTQDGKSHWAAAQQPWGSSRWWGTGSQSTVRSENIITVILFARAGWQHKIIYFLFTGFWWLNSFEELDYWVSRIYRLYCFYSARWTQGCLSTVEVLKHNFLKSNFEGVSQLIIRMLKREEPDYNRDNLQELLALPEVWIIIFLNNFFKNKIYIISFLRARACSLWVR